MKKIAWVTDSTAVMDEKLAIHPDVYSVPLSILLDDEEYLDNIDLTAEELFKRLKTLKNPAKTSQPSVGAFKILFEKLQAEYDEIISILVSAKLSGTVSSSVQAAQLVDIPVTTIDSKVLSYPLTAQIKRGVEWISEGLSVQAVKEKIERLRDMHETYVLVGNLEQLHRSGRMKGLQYMLGSLLNIKPIIQVFEGVLTIKDKARSEKKAKNMIVEYLRQSYEKYNFKEVNILYGYHLHEALKWKEELVEKFPKLEFSCYPLGAVIGVHAGEHTLGISWYKDIDEKRS